MARLALVRHWQIREWSTRMGFCLDRSQADQPGSGMPVTVDIVNGMTKDGGEVFI